MLVSFYTVQGSIILIAAHFSWFRYKMSVLFQADLLSLGLYYMNNNLDNCLLWYNKTYAEVISRLSLDIKWYIHKSLL